MATISNEAVLDFVLGQLPATELAEFQATLRQDPSVALRVRRAQVLLAPLQLVRTEVEPPVGLALAGLERTAQHCVEHGLFHPGRGFCDDAPLNRPSLSEPRRWLLTRQHVNVAVIAAMLFVAVGLGLHMIQHARRQAELLACQNNLRDMHQSLAGYSELHAGQFPKAGSANVPVAGDFLAELQRSGQTVADGTPWCPTVGRMNAPVGYAYTLGYRDGNELNGLWKPGNTDDLTPILADLPLKGDLRQPVHGGWNVLTVGGAVQFTTVATVGLNGDDIFRNAAGERRAGLNRFDTCLGLPYDRP